jgi:fatty acid desaturase
MTNLAAHLIALDGVLYDVASFAKLHPGGSQIRTFGGTDVTHLVRSVHGGRRVEKSQLLSQCLVGKAPYPTPAPNNHHSPFANAARAAVAEALRGTSPYAPIGFWVRAVLILVLTGAMEWHWADSGALWAGVGVGLLHASIGLCIQHDASHGAVSSHPWVNALLARTLDWIGGSARLWRQQHIQSHHPYTSHSEDDVDAHVFSQTIEALTPHGMVAAIGLGALGPSIVFAQIPLLVHGVRDDVPQLAPTGARTAAAGSIGIRLLDLLFRAWYILRICVLPWMAGAHWVAACFLVPCSGGALLGILFTLSHNFIGATLLGGDDWFAAQAAASCNYGGTVAGFLTGGLNFQIEHHLFPRICSWHYARIAPRVREVATQHGVPYQHFATIGENMWSTWNFLTNPKK